jgi:hypothetical protein
LDRRKELIALPRYDGREGRSGKIWLRYLNSDPELDLELIMTQKPMLRVEVDARVCAQVKNM